MLQPLIWLKREVLLCFPSGLEAPVDLETAGQEKGDAGVSLRYRDEQQVRLSWRQSCVVVPLTRGIPNTDP